jgi:hypothetical protein
VVALPLLRLLHLGRVLPVPLFTLLPRRPLRIPPRNNLNLNLKLKLNLSPKRKRKHHRLNPIRTLLSHLHRSKSMTQLTRPGCSSCNMTRDASSAVVRGA